MSASAMRAVAAGAAAALALAAGPAGACGVCVEDKVAVTYDHAVVVRAAAQKHVVVFASIDGMGGAEDLARDASAAAKRVPGVDRDSVRSASAPVALSFALDPAARSPESAVAEVERRAKSPGLKLSVLRVIR